MPHILAIGSDNDLELTKLKVRRTGVLPIDAVVTCSLLDSLGAPVTGAQNLAMPYVAASGSIPAAYVGVVPSTVVLVPGPYTARFTATTGGRVRRWDEACIAVA